MSDAFTYEAEVLPEIEIQELVSFEELLDSMPSFVAFSQDEIFQHMSQLLQDKQRAATFQALFNFVKQPEAPSLDHIVPVLKTSVETIDEEKLRDITIALEATSQAPNYQSQMDEIIKIMYPLNKLSGPYETPIIPVTVGLENGLKKRFVLLPFDKVSHELFGSAFRRPNVTASSMIHERVNTHTIPEFPMDDEIQKDKLPQDLHVDFQDVCNKLTSIVDANSLRVHLESYGFQLESLNEDECAILIQRLQVVATEDIDESEKSISKDAAEYDVTKLQLIPRKEMWEQFEALLNAPISVDKFRVLWEGLAYSTQLLQPSVEIPNNVHDIAVGLVENKFSLEDVIGYLKYKRSLSEYELLRTALERFQSVSIEDVTSLVQELKQKWSRIFQRYVDRAPEKFVTLYRDMAEIKEGRDDASYMGDVREYVFEEQANEALDADVDDDDDIIDEDVQPPSQQYDLRDASLGVREVLDSILPKIEKLRVSSGLPLDMQALIGYLISSISRVSRVEYLTQAVPALSLQVKNQVVLMDMERALHMANFITPTELAAPLREAIKQAWSAYETDEKHVFIEAIAWWVLELQERALQRELIFDVTKGMMACIRKWSPWGPPLQSDKGEGALEYLSCCAKETKDVWTWPSDDLKKLVLQSIDDNPKVEGMKMRFKELGKTILTMSEKAKAANISLGEVIENKQKNRYLPEFVKTYMLLPGLLAGHQPKMNVGCCLQTLDENFHADSDWRGVLKRLRDVKDAFAKKRSTMVDMPAYATFVPVASQEEESDVHNVSDKISIVPLELFKINEWIQEWSSMNLSFVTMDMIASAYADPNKALSHSEKFIQMAVNTSGSKQKQHGMITFMKEEASWGYLEQLLKLITFTIKKETFAYQDASLERTVLEGAVRELTSVKRHMQKLQGVFDEVEFSLIRPIYIYIISRAVCLPAIPETSSNQRLTIQAAVSAGFLSKTVKSVLDMLKQNIAAGKMPSLDEQKLFITNVREKQKIDILNVLDEKTVDDRQVMLDAKKLGLISLLKQPVAADTQAEDTEEDGDEDGESEFRSHGQNTDDNDLDNLDD